MAGTIRCPHCGTHGATKFLWMVKCPSSRCRHYDAALAKEHERRHRVPTGNFNPGPNAIQVQYTNYEGEKKTYTGDRTTVRKRNNHISLVLAPAGKRCAFEISRVSNMAALTPFIAADDALSAADRQVLAYHRKRGSTSPRFQEVLRKIGKTS